MTHDTHSFFRSRSQVVGDCWEWTGPRTADGYGKLKLGGRTVLAHRLALARSLLVSIDDLPSGMYVCHSCDNPPCVNPAHLGLGTAADNYNDSVKRGRRPPLKTECPHGHAYDDANTRVDRRGRRHCRACDRARSLARRPALIRGRYRRTHDPRGIPSSTE